MGEFDLVNLMRVCNGLVNQLQPQAVRRLRMLNSWGPIGRHKEGGLRMRNSGASIGQHKEGGLRLRNS